MPWKNYRIWINTFQAIRVHRLFKSIPIQKSDYMFKYIWFPSLDLDSKWWKKSEIRITNKYSTQCKIWIKKTSINLMWFELISSIWFELAKTLLCLKNVHYHNSRLYNSFGCGTSEYLLLYYTKPCLFLLIDYHSIMVTLCVSGLWLESEQYGC